jgi:hypothetical protein
MEQSSGGEALRNVTASVPGSAADVIAFHTDALAAWSTENESNFSGGGTETRSVTFVLGDRRLDLVANDTGEGPVQMVLSHTEAGG